MTERTAPPVETGPHTVTATLAPEVWRAVVSYAAEQKQKPETVVAESVRAYLFGEK